MKKLSKEVETKFPSINSSNISFPEINKVKKKRKISKNENQWNDSPLKNLLKKSKTVNISDEESSNSSKNNSNKNKSEGNIQKDEDETTEKILDSLALTETM